MSTECIDEIWYNEILILLANSWYSMWITWTQVVKMPHFGWQGDSCIWKPLTNTQIKDLSDLPFVPTSVGPILLVSGCVRERKRRNGEIHSSHTFLYMAVPWGRNSHWMTCWIGTEYTCRLLGCLDKPCSSWHSFSLMLLAFSYSLPPLNTLFTEKGKGVPLQVVLLILTNSREWWSSPFSKP